ncbi:unnamed protein product [Linum trigynum]|uniref:Cyclin-dependent kinase inhibitor domain-containing protein n=1 Tax=Linum trigynum TaxID=586398 RepID=A0AAV2GDF6_9ROSI
MARVGVTTRPRPFPLASSSSTPNSPPPSSSSTKRRKFNHRGAAGGREHELTSGGGDSATSAAAGDSSSGRRSGEIERCFTSPSAAAADAEEGEEEGVDRLCSDDSCCSSNGSSEGASKFSDLQQEDEQAEVEIESPTNCGGERERRETTSSRSTVIIKTATGEEVADELKSMERPDELRNSTAVEMGEEESSAAVRNSSTANQQRIVVTEAELELFFSSMNGGKQELNRLNEKYNFDFANEKPLEGRYEWIPLKP